MRCLACHRDNEEGLQFCTSCGAELGTVCPRCSFQNRGAARFCGRCSEPLGGPPSAAPPSTPAERRQLTVLFCDLVNATGLSERLDPEDLRDVLREYQRRCAEIVRGLDGHVAQYLGDGMLVYFGFPLAHEDSTQRAVRAGLSIVQAVSQITPRYRAATGASLQVRVGIHTGAVVIGEMGDASRPELLAVGETPNLAARVQGAAEANRVVVSEATYRLTRGYFTFTELGALSLKGFSRAANLYRVEAETGARSRLEVVGAGELTPFAGREDETAFVLDRWKEALDRTCPAICVGGEPGIGKSRLVRVVRERLEAEDVIALECYSSPSFQGTAFHPVLEMIERQLGFTRETSASQRFAKLKAELGRVHLEAPETVGLLASLLSIPTGEGAAPVALSPPKLRQATFDVLIAWLHAVAAERPTLFIVEDLHWADPSTLELLALLVDRAPPGPLMVLLTHRAEFALPWSSPRLAKINLSRMPHAEAQQIIAAVMKDKPLPKEVVNELLAQADGVPLYIEEITKQVLESGQLRPADSSGDAMPSSSRLPIPPAVQDSLTARLDRLGTGKAVVQLAATVGRSFRFELLQAVSGTDEGPLRGELDRLVGSGLMFRSGILPNETYTFKHALIQDAAYASLLRSARQTYHRRIAGVLTDSFSELADAQPELLAQHYVRAGMAAQAIANWIRAGQQAIARSAYSEALSGFRSALEQLATLPASTERDRLEVEVRSTFGVALISTRGYAAPEVEENYARAGELCEGLGNLSPAVLYGVWGVHLVRSDAEATARLARLLEGLATTSKDPTALLMAYSSLGVRAFWCAQYGNARDLFTKAWAPYHDAQGASGKIAALGAALGFEGYLYPLLYLVCCDAFEGFPDRAQTRWCEAMELAEMTQNPYAIAMVLAFGSALAMDLKDLDRAKKLGSRLIGIAAENGFHFWLALAHTSIGSADAREGKLEAGIAQINSGLTLLRTIGGFLVYPVEQTRLAEAYLLSGRLDEALATANEMLAFCDGKLAIHYVPVALRIRGDILAALGERDAAEQDYRRSLAMAREQGAKLFELQTSIGLARLLRDTNRSDDARSLLSPIHAYFTEGLDLPDLKTAQTLLGELR
jgi:class 3 adenylate cyclase/tetratricopeptide (TPR) repeat protein